MLLCICTALVMLLGGPDSLQNLKQGEVKASWAQPTEMLQATIISNPPQMRTEKALHPDIEYLLVYLMQLGMPWNLYNHIYRELFVERFYMLKGHSTNNKVSCIS